MILYIFQNCTYFDKKKLREIYEDTQKLKHGALGTPKIWDRVSPGNLARVSNLWPWAHFKEIRIAFPVSRTRLENTKVILSRCSLLINIQNGVK